MTATSRSLSGRWLPRAREPKSSMTEIPGLSLEAAPPPGCPAVGVPDA